MKAYLVEAWVDGSVYPKNNRSSGAAILISKQLKAITVRSLISSGGRQTNNTGEILAIIAAIESINKKVPVKLHIHSDSQYALGGLAKYMHYGRVYNKNRELWNRLIKAVKARPNLSITTTHVPGHSGIQFNEVAHSFAYASAVLEVETYIERVSLEELNDLLKKEQERVKYYLSSTKKGT